MWFHLHDWCGCFWEHSKSGVRPLTAIYRGHLPYHSEGLAFKQKCAQFSAAAWESSGRKELCCCHLLLPFQISSLSYWGMSGGHQCHGGDRRRSHCRRAWGTRVIIVATLGNIIYQRNQSPSYYHFFSSKVCHAVLIDLTPLRESWGAWTYQV